jgi:signal transduction histidine kinase
MQRVLMDAIIDDIETSHIELKLRLKNDEIRILLVSASIRRDAASKITGVIFVCSNDITALQEEQKYQFRIQAEVDFTNFLAHEVRDPLNRIESASFLLMKNLEKLNEHLDSASQRLDKWTNLTTTESYLNSCESDTIHINDCVEYISSIMLNTLDLSKLEKNKLHFSTEVIMLLRDVLRPALAMLQNNITRDVQVNVYCDEDIILFAGK